MPSWAVNLAVWGFLPVYFLIFELSAIIGKAMGHPTPWSPLSDAVWSTEQVVKILPWLVIAFFIWLTLHLTIKAVVWR